MHHTLFEPAKKDKQQPVNDQTMGVRYPHVVTFYPDLKNETLSKLVETMSIKIRPSEFSQKLCMLSNNPVLRDDFLIEATINKHSDLIKWMDDHYLVRATKDIIKKYINSIIDDQHHKLELTLCAQDTPTELLEIINNKINHIIFDPYTKCTDLLLNRFYYQCIFRYLSVIDRQDCNKNIDNAICNFKFLRDVVENYFPNSQIFLQRATNLFYEKKDQICKYNSQIEKEWPLLFNSAPSSVEQSKPKF
jgi:hypothetical protein